MSGCCVGGLSVSPALGGAIAECSANRDVLMEVLMPVADLAHRGVI
jgi:hypothetical protein